MPVYPQRGPQEAFLSSAADIAIYGGAAGAGKTYAMLLEALRHVTTNADFAAIFFRRNTTQIRNPGGLWDEAMKVYPATGATPVSHVLEWRWPQGGKVKMSHLEHEHTVHDFQGSQLPLIIWDELCHFTKYQFFYMLSRNRSMCGVQPYVRASCNPDADSWVAEFINWWIDQETGFPIAERSGVLRWFVRINDSLIWADSAEALREQFNDPQLPDDDPAQVRPISLTFVPGTLSDNPALMRADPGYLSKLKSLPVIEQARLLGGNWKIRASSGLFFQRAWVEVVDVAPAGLDIVRYWDLASTEKTDKNDPDWTIGVKMGYERKSGLIYILHVLRLRVSPLKVEQALQNTANQDGVAVRIGLPQDPGQAGKSQAQAFVRKLAGLNVRTKSERGDKVTRCGPISAQFQAHNVRVLRGAWNDDYFTALEAFPAATAHDDDVDATSGAYDMFMDSQSGILDYYRAQELS